MLLAFEAVAAESIVAAVERGRVGASSSVVGNNVLFPPSTILSGNHTSVRFASPPQRLPQTASSEKWRQAGRASCTFAAITRCCGGVWWKEFAEFFLMLESQLVTPCILTIFGKSKIGEYLDTRNQPNNAESAKYSIYLVLSLHGY